MFSDMRRLKRQSAIGKTLRETRLGKNMPLCVVVEELKDLKIKCSLANLGKIETGNISCRADILGALCLVYDINPEDVLYF
jgi:hypothetical protein